MKSLRGYPANYSPVSYEDVDITHMNYGEETAPRSYLEQIRYLLEEGNAGGYVSAFDRGFSGGLGRKVGGFINAVGSYPVDRAAEWLGYENVPSFSDRYNEIVQQADTSEQQLREEHPYAAMGTELLGNAFGLGSAAYGIAGRFGLNGVTRLGGAGAIDAAVNTFGGAENISDAITTLPLNTIGGYAGGAIMGKLGEFGSKYGGQVLDWGQNKFSSKLNNRMQGILTDTSGHSINIPEIAARRQQIYDNFVFQNADKEVLDFTPTRRQLEAYIAQSKFNPNKNYTKEQAEKVLRERLSETNLNVFNDDLSNLGNPELGINHFLKEGKDPFVRTAARTYLYPDLKFTKDGTDYYVRKYFNNKSNKDFQDMFLVREGKAFNKLPSSNNHIANKLKGAQDLSLAPTLRAMTTTGASLSNINITPQPVVVNKKLPNVSDLYNELTPRQVEIMNNALRQGLGQSTYKAGTLDSIDKIRRAANMQNGAPADLSAVRSNINNVMKPHTGQLDDKLAQVKRVEQYYQQGYQNQPIARNASGQQFHNNVEKQAYLQGQMQRLSQGEQVARDVLDNQAILQPLMTDKRYNRLYSKAQHSDDAYRNVLELRARYAKYLRDMYNKTAPHAVNDITQHRK